MCVGVGLLARHSTETGGIKGSSVGGGDVRGSLAVATFAQYWRPLCVKRVNRCEV